jgi:hypothetical protein
VLPAHPTPRTLTNTRRPVVVVTPSGPITQPPRPVASPVPPDGGALLEGECQSTTYTLLDAGDMVIYAPLVGCNADRPECCPWNVSTGAGPEGNRVAAAPGEFPAPASSAKESLDKCPQDYYPVSGLCCPKYVPSAAASSLYLQG